MSILKILYCYAQSDRRLALELEKHLSPLKHIEDLASWLPFSVQAVKTKDPPISWDDHDISLLLLSSDFLASTFCSSGQLTSLLQRQQAKGTIGIPVILRPCLWDKTSLSHLKALPRNGKPITLWRNRDAAFLDVVIEIWSVVKKTVETHHQEIVARFASQFLSNGKVPSKGKARKMLEKKGLKVNHDSVAVNSFRNKKALEKAEKYYASFLNKLQGAQTYLAREASTIVCSFPEEIDSDLYNRWETLLGKRLFPYQTEESPARNEVSSFQERGSRPPEDF